MSRGKLRNTMAFHVRRDGVSLRIERPLLQSRCQRVIGASDCDELSAADRLLDTCGPGRVGTIRSTGVDDLAADDTRSGRQARCKAGGNAEADDGLASLGNRTLDELFEPRSVPSPATALTPSDRAAMRASARRPAAAMTKPGSRPFKLTSRPERSWCWRL